MPVDVLLVEGKLDRELLAAVLRGRPTVERGGSKASLAPEVRRRRQGNPLRVCYIRDRDFDFDPAADWSQPTVDRMDGNQILGWRWCRHEIENYLLEPQFVAMATGWNQPEYEAELLQVALDLRYYQVARWAIGKARSSLPPHYEMETRPDDLGEIGIPLDLSATFSLAWARQLIASHLSRIQSFLSATTVQASIDSMSKLLDAPAIEDPSQVLIWWSGKDLFAGLAPWLARQHRASAGEFRAELRDWFAANPTDAIEAFPEWQRLISLLNE